MTDASYKWRLLAFLFVTFFLELGARQVFNATLPQIKVEFARFAVTDAQLGLVGSVFGAVFGLSLVGSGLAADFFGRKRVLVLGTLLFSFGVFCCGFAHTLAALVVCYGVLNAVGQCCVAPPCYSLISQYHDNRTRSTAMGIFQSALYLGIVLSSVLSGFLADVGEGGWRRAFWILGGIGALWAFVLQLGLRDTPQPQSPANDSNPSVKDAFMALLGKPTAVLIALAFGMYMYANLGIRLWSTAFLSREFCGGGGLASAALHSVLWLNLGSFVGMFATARFMDRCGRCHPRIRLDVSVVGFLLCIAPVIWVSRTGSLAECCVALATLGFTLGVYEAAHYPAMFDCIAPRYRSVTTGLTGCWAFLFGSLAPTVIGWMGDRLSLRAGFASLSLFYLVGALLLLPAVFRFFKKDYIGE